MRQRYATKAMLAVCRSTELSRMCMWLKENHCMNVAMESTGVYWLPIYDQIEEEIPEIQSLPVVNPAHMHNVPGRKSDIKDPEWIAQLLQHGCCPKASYRARMCK
ncbi:MAG: transposase [Christensenellales bacterium]